MINITREEAMLYNQNMPVYFTPIPVHREDEIYVPITNNIIPGVCDYYLISNYGRIWNKYKSKFEIIYTDTKGYSYCALMTVNNGPVKYRVHRLVGLFFMYIPGCENLNINHKYGCKTDNYVGHLEWTTQKENMIHARQELMNQQNYSEDTVKQVCEMLQEGKKTINEIGYEVDMPYTMISAINKGKIFTDISKNYVFAPRLFNTNFTDEQVKSICKYASMNPKPNDISKKEYYRIVLSNSLNINDPSDHQISSVERILNKTTYSNISKNYNI